jgi:hypothetical protein
VGDTGLPAGEEVRNRSAKSEVNHERCLRIHIERLLKSVMYEVVVDLVKERRLQSLSHPLQPASSDDRLLLSPREAAKRLAISELNLESYAYESAFVRWPIQKQIKGEPPHGSTIHSRGDVKAPLLLWGPYLRADGKKGREVDDFVWKRDNLAGDGAPPSTSGWQNLAEQLLRFFKTDPTRKMGSWKPEASRAAIAAG